MVELVPSPKSQYHEVGDPVLLSVNFISSPLKCAAGDKFGMGPINWPKATGVAPTGIVAVTLFVAVSITETVLLNSFVIYAYGVAPAIFTNIKTKAIETKAIEYNLF